MGCSSVTALRSRCCGREASARAAGPQPYMVLLMLSPGPHWFCRTLLQDGRGRAGRAREYQRSPSSTVGGKGLVAERLARWCARAGPLRTCTLEEVWVICAR